MVLLLRSIGVRREERDLVVRSRGGMGRREVKSVAKEEAKKREEETEKKEENERERVRNGIPSKQTHT